MGKKRSGKDQLHMTSTEWKDYGGFTKRQASTSDFRRLPFDCCALSFLPFEHPVCNMDGVIYDLLNIVPWIKKHGTDPATGSPLLVSDLVKLKFTKSEDDKDYICPISRKTFNEYSHIVAIKVTGNVYSFDAIDKLCFKAKNLKRADIIQIQDPQNVSNKNLNNLHYIKNKIEKPVVSKEEPKTISNPSMNRIMAELKDPTPAPQAAYSDQKAAMSFTSSSVDLVTVNEAVKLTSHEQIYKNVGKAKKAYCQIQTNLGNLNFELYCSLAPMTCYNFINLSKSGYYKGCKIHRLIKNFMFQTGDPEGTGRGGDSFFSGTFPDEFSSKLTHSKRGILSMANSGPNSNKSQFFCTFKPCSHLDRKHSVFGCIVGEGDVLDVIEKIPTDDTDAPVMDLIVRDILVFDDPFQAFKDRLNKKTEREAKGDTVAPAVQEGQEGGVGKYLGKVQVSSSGEKRGLDALDESYALEAERKKSKMAGKGGFGNFDSW